jgi:hypothetical protein
LIKRIPAPTLLSEHLSAQNCTQIVDAAVHQLKASQLEPHHDEQRQGFFSAPGRMPTGHRPCIALNSAFTPNPNLASGRGDQASASPPTEQIANSTLHFGQFLDEYSSICHCLLHDILATLAGGVSNGTGDNLRETCPCFVKRLGMPLAVWGPRLD